MSLFDGWWYLVQSSFDDDQRTGCLTWQINTENSDGFYETAYAKNKLFSWNPFEKGHTSSRQFKLRQDGSGGILKQVRVDMFGSQLETTYGRVIATDYTTYAIVYFCLP